MKIAVCDDEDYFLNMISDYCKAACRENGIPISLISFTCGQDVLSYYQQNKDVDLFILDIKMPDITGMQIAEEIRKTDIHTKIIFLTSAPEFAPQGYVFGVNRYWIKPLTYTTFITDIQTLYKEMKKANASYLVETIGTSTEKVYFDEILYIETHERKSCIHREDSHYLSTTKLNAYEKKLDQRFFRCHASYIVNMNYVAKIKGYEVILGNGDTIYMSKGRKKDFLTALSSYFV